MMQHEIRYAFNASMSDNSDGTKPWAPQPEIEWLSLFMRVPNKAEVQTIAAAVTVIHQRDAASRLDRRARTIARVLRTRTHRADERGSRRVVSARRSLFTPLRPARHDGRVAADYLRQCRKPARRPCQRPRARDRRARRDWRPALARDASTARGESVLAFVGGTLGLLAAAWGRDLLLSMFARGATIIDLDTTFDWRVLLFATSSRRSAGWRQASCRPFAARVCPPPSDQGASATGRSRWRPPRRR